MFRIQTKPEVRILDTPLKMHITNKFILVPIPETDQVMFIYGNFKHIRDADAFALAKKNLDKVA